MFSRSALACGDIVLEICLGQGLKQVPKMTTLFIDFWAGGQQPPGSSGRV